MSFLDVPETYFFMAGKFVEAQKSIINLTQW